MKIHSRNVQAEPPASTTTDSLSTTANSADFYPDWREFLLPFILGVLLIPVAGTGLWIIYHYHRKWKQIQYRITDSRVTCHGPDKSIEIFIHQINHCHVVHRWLPGLFGLADLLIDYQTGQVRLLSIKNSEKIAMLLEQAAHMERQRMKWKLQAREYAPEYASGTLDRLNELVGLWQQGLISEDDYQAERKKLA